mmetsp:Transcript_45678/g.115457  ORF Transcript_45678/g.115457 Transcript_45678/m.115457 type:complete len:220 (-) Transcript_45678:118-777(-)
MVGGQLRLECLDVLDDGLLLVLQPRAHLGLDVRHEGADGGGAVALLCLQLRDTGLQLRARLARGRQVALQLRVVRRQRLHLVYLGLQCLPIVGRLGVRLRVQSQLLLQPAQHRAHLRHLAVGGRQAGHQADAGEKQHQQGGGHVQRRHRRKHIVPARAVAAHGSVGVEERQPLERVEQAAGAVAPRRHGCVALPMPAAMPTQCGARPPVSALSELSCSI